MARHGENIRKRSDGRWEGRYKVFSRERGIYVYRSVYGSSYEAVKEKRITVKNHAKEYGKTQTGKNRTGEEITFGIAAEEWQKDNAGKRKRSTCVKYKSVYDRYLGGTMAKYPISEITAELVGGQLSEGLSDSLLKSIYCVINRILAFAEEHYSIRVQKLKKAVPREKRKPVTVLSRGEQGRLLACLYRETDICKMAVIFCLNTGLRLGEICGLKWKDIDFENMTVTVNRTVQRIAISGMETKTTLLETAPKSESSIREIPVSSKLLELLKRFGNGEDYIFGGEKPLEPRTLQYRFKKLLKEAGLSDKNFHALRHTFATNCVEGGTDVKSLSEMMGHSDVQITLNRYVHPSMEVKRRHLDGLWQFYGRFPGQENGENRYLQAFQDVFTE